MTYYSNGEFLTYIGYFEGSKRHGFGIMTYSSGEVREGLFEYGVLIPPGRVAKEL